MFDLSSALKTTTNPTYRSGPLPANPGVSCEVYSAPFSCDGRTNKAPLLSWMKNPKKTPPQSHPQNRIVGEIPFIQNSYDSDIPIIPIGSKGFLLWLGSIIRDITQQPEFWTLLNWNNLSPSVAGNYRPSGSVLTCLDLSKITEANMCREIVGTMEQPFPLLGASWYLGTNIVISWFVTIFNRCKFIIIHL